MKDKRNLFRHIARYGAPIDWNPKPVTMHPLTMVEPEKERVVISEEEHEAYKKFLAARGTRKAGNQFDEEGRRFRP